MAEYAIARVAAQLAAEKNTTKEGRRLFYLLMDQVERYSREGK